jgi:hypothetical protein
MLPNSLLYMLVLATFSAAWFIPPPRIPRPPPPQIIQPIRPPPRPIEPAPRPNNRPDPEIPDVPDDNSQDTKTSKSIPAPYPAITSRVLTPSQAWESSITSGPVATSTTGAESKSRPSKTARQSATPTEGMVSAVTGGAVRMESLGLRMWGSVVGLVSSFIKTSCKNDKLMASRLLCH